MPAMNTARRRTSRLKSSGLSSAFIVVRGGIGTTLETALIWQLLQVSHVSDVPLILIGDMWKDFADWTQRHMLANDPQLASPEDLDPALRGDRRRGLQAHLGEPGPVQRRFGDRRL